MFKLISFLMFEPISVEILEMYPITVFNKVS